MHKTVVEALLDSNTEWDRTNHLASAIRAYNILFEKNLLASGEHIRDKIIDVIMHHPNIYEDKTPEEDAELIYDVLSNNGLLK